MPITRSQASKRVEKQASSATASSTTSSKKRKASESSTAKPTKRAKKPPSSPQQAKTAEIVPPRARDREPDVDDSSYVVTINRAPVLELWAASVAQFLHPSMPWTTCLSVGGAISAITAISKGRAIGKIDKSDPASAEDRKQKRREQQADFDDVEVMGFRLHIQDGNAIVGDKPKKSDEGALVKKYGSQEYNRVKDTFARTLTTWKGREDELDKGALHMYEDFRPSVPAGQKGWGRKGQLSLKTIQSVVRMSE